MKKALLTTLSAILLVFALGCGGNDDDDDNNNNNNNNNNTPQTFVKCKINGVSFQATVTNVYIDKTNSTLSVFGAKGEEKSISIVVENMINTGTFNLTTPNTAAGLFYADKTVTPNVLYTIDYLKAGASGTVTITEVTPLNSTRDNVKGTFSGVAYNTNSTDSVVITDGEFASQ